MPPPSPAAHPTPSQLQLLADIAVMLGLPAADGARLAAPQVFTGPAGLVCRLWLQPEANAARPEVLLPLRAREFRDESLERLLKVQSLLLDQLGWYLGASTDGMLSLMPLAWLEDAQAIAASLDMANGIAMAALPALIDVGRTTAATERRQ
jgi:hypothetical protein